MTPETAAAVRTEQLEVLYRQARVAFVPNLLAVPALVYALYGDVAPAKLLAWGAFMYLVTGGRAFLVWLHAHRRRDRRVDERWFWPLATGNAMSGAGWGAAAWLFIAGTPPLAQAFVIVNIAAMTAGAVSALATSSLSYTAFAVPCLTPLIARMFVEAATRPSGGSAYLLVGLLTILYLVMQLHFARNTERTMLESIRLRFENVDLVAQLTREKERAEAASVAKTKFLAAASHDLRQPVHALGLFIDALRSEQHAPRARHLVEAVAESQQAATVLLDNLLEFSRVQSGSLAPSLRVFGVQSLLDALRHDFTVQASAAELELRIRPCDAFVRSDVVMLTRLMGNLVSNAIRYTEHGGVLVACRRRGAHLSIEVHDTGVGIPADRHGDIFREFYQVDGSRSRGRTVGMGLGLAIVAGLSQALEHAVTVASRPGHGSTFTVRVPLAQGVDAREPTFTPAGRELAGHAILVIDDDPAIVEALDAILVRWGCEPVGASSAEEAIERLQGRPAPSAMVVDAQLAEGATGLAAIAAVRAVLGRGVPAIMVTGDTDPERMREASDFGFPVLHKPVSAMRLRAALSASIEARSDARQPA
jgi:signal transduction histidine kinase/ActR/RegA family two-component response regulator